MALRNSDFDAASPHGSPKAGITLAVGHLGAFDQQTVRTMLQTLVTRLSAYFRIVDGTEGDLVLLEHPTDAELFLLRANVTPGTGDVKLPRPLRLMPLADGLNAMIDIVRPLAQEPARDPEHTLLRVLDRPATHSMRLVGEWGTCWMYAGTDDVVFDRPLTLVARALANGAVVGEVETVTYETVALAARDGRPRLRRDEVRWLIGPSAELQRATHIKLMQPEAWLKLQVWPNLARLPQHMRWLDVFAAMHDGIPATEALRRATDAGLSEADARRGICMLLQLGYANLRMQPVAQVTTAPSIADKRETSSFLQRIRNKLRQIIETA
ncbi:hypothetical protein ACQQ2N_02500 [Dokdonella sp. MW10]|uniref:hypothetical protein n=1 Tax=Dokdonella sp. MW10 TaxID=2992926 RepID=UPI003F7D5F40